MPIRILVALFAGIFVPVFAFAQTPLEIAYEQDQLALQRALNEVAGPTRAAIVLPVSALENQTIARSISQLVVDPESNVAIEGFDPVGYFTEGKAMVGDAAYRAEFEGSVFYFASQEHRDMFLETPKKYIPAYGGYCTETLAMGALTPASPLHWTVHGERLYLTRSAQANKAFREHRQRSVDAAATHWSQADALLASAHFRATRN